VVTDPLADEDLHLALLCAYEQHYRGLEGVDEAWEWNPSLLAARAGWEAPFEQALLATIPRPAGPADPRETDLALRALIDADDAPAVSRYVETRATLGQFCELLVHRSAYQLKEADPTRSRSPGSRAGPRPRWSRSRPTSTARGGPSASTPTCSLKSSRTSASTPATAPIWTTCPA
jgi:hypothetical protein